MAFSVAIVTMVISKLKLAHDSSIFYNAHEQARHHFFCNAVGTRKKTKQLQLYTPGSALVRRNARSQNVEISRPGKTAI